MRMTSILNDIEREEKIYAPNIEKKSCGLPMEKHKDSNSPDKTFNPLLSFRLDCVTVPHNS